MKTYALRILVGLSLWLHPVPSQPPGKIAPKPLYRDPVYDGAADPTLVWDRANHRWLMFYTNRRANVPHLPGVSWVHGTHIGIAASTDRGTTWKYIGTADIDYGKPDCTQWAPEIIEHDGLYHMYLSIVPGTFSDWNHPRFIIHLTSKELQKWRYRSTLDLASDRVIDPCVIQLPTRPGACGTKTSAPKMALSTTPIVRI